ncbi:hypothetical protein LMG28614_00558 [Paraburkholderia ultramafica]|uniref:Uncharacterized protein n=1 Tax=Paraburkholderia ultramafica TaxID=1544867 RepID=A0A6S7AU58_9BURK|nr:hypothetical protein [Paraburkholderia ultramafica]CAB3778171.1 hypothetical protein LMG28614_00558 [Paraburkholderia ultramafica]
MPFDPAQLAAQMQNPNLATWANCDLNNQAQYIAAYTVYFNGIQTWIDQNGGDGNPFGWDNVNGLEVNGLQVVLQGPAQKAPFNDAFNDVRAHLGQPGFRLFQAAEANQRLITVLSRM